MKTLWEKCVRIFRYILSLRIPVYASHAGFFMVLSAFPTLVLLMGLVRYTGLEIHNLTELLVGVIPNALLPAAEKLIVNTYYSTTGTVLSLSAVTALWSASRGIYGLLTGLNTVYGVTETRSYLHIRLLCVVYTFLFLLVLLLTLVLHVFGSAALKLLPLYPVLDFLEELIGMRFFLLLGLQALLFAAMFTVLPNGRRRFAAALPGALLAACGWLIFSDLYSIYVEHFAGLSNIYGSVYAVALSMLWLYCCVSILFYGGALNRWLTNDNG